MLDKKNLFNNEESAILVGVVKKDETEQQVKEYLDELAFLAETAGALAVKRFVQKLSHPDSKTFVGKGKLEEIARYVAEHGIRTVIFDDELTGSQITNIKRAKQAVKEAARVYAKVRKMGFDVQYLNVPEPAVACVCLTIGFALRGRRR